MARETLEKKALFMQALAERRANDPLFLWQPHPKQREFINSVLGRECYLNLALWANRSGKTDSFAFVVSKLARFGLPDEDIKPAIGSRTVVYDRATSGWAVALTSKMNRDVLQPKIFNNGFVPAGVGHPPFIPDREIDEWRVSDQILKLKNGSIMGFKSCADGRETFQGAGKDYVGFDEEPPKPIYQEATIRVEAGRRLRVFMTCTLLPPEGQVGGVTWVYTELAKPYLDGKPVNCRVFQASIYDNPHLLSEEVALLEAKYPEGSVERRIRLDGELLPGLSGARAYGAFNYQMHVGDVGEIEPRRPLCWCLDFNVEPMVSLIGQRAGRVFKVFRELILEEGSAPEMGRWFRQEYPTHRAEIWVYGDATGKSRDVQTAKSDYQVLLNELRGYAVPIKLRVPDKNPDVPSRINAVNRALKDEYGEIGAQIAPSCVELIADLEGVLRDPKGGIRKTYNKSDPYVRRTHTSDAISYWIAYEQPVTNEPLGVRREVQSLTRHDLRMKLPSYGSALSGL